MSLKSKQKIMNKKPLIIEEDDCELEHTNLVIKSVDELAELTEKYLGVKI